MLNRQQISIKLSEISDAEDLLKLELNNRDFFRIYTPLRSEKFYTLEGQIERINKDILQVQENTGYSFGIFLLDNKELIGHIALSGVVRGDLQSCWIGYCLDKRHNGKGYMTEAINFAVDYAFKELKLHRIEAGVMPHNKGSIKVLEKAGFHKEGIAKENVRINGRWEDHQTLAIVKNEEG